MNWQQVLVLLSSAAALGSIIWLVMTRRRREPTALPEVKTFRKDWPPLTLVVDTEFEVDDMLQLEQSLKAAACFWNSACSRLFSSPGELLADGHTIPVMQAPSWELDRHPDAVAYTHLSLDSDGALTGAAVYIMPRWKDRPEVLHRALAHELGHCLGLEHDEENGGSVMYHKAIDAPFEVTVKDKTFLNSVYR